MFFKALWLAIKRLRAKKKLENAIQHFTLDLLKTINEHWDPTKIRAAEDQRGLLKSAFPFKYKGGESMLKLGSFIAKRIYEPEVDGTVYCMISEFGARPYPSDILGGVPYIPHAVVFPTIALDRMMSTGVILSNELLYSWWIEGKVNVDTQKYLYMMHQAVIYHEIGHVLVAAKEKHDTGKDRYRISYSPEEEYQADQVAVSNGNLSGLLFLLLSVRSVMILLEKTRGIEIPKGAIEELDARFIMAVVFAFGMTHEAAHDVLKDIVDNIIGFDARIGKADSKDLDELVAMHLSESRMMQSAAYESFVQQLIHFTPKEKRDFWMLGIAHDRATSVELFENKEEDHVKNEKEYEKLLSEYKTNHKEWFS